MNAPSVKRKRNSEVTSEQIFAAATAEFSEKGFGGARVDNIAERANINKSMIYHYFNNKEQLFTAVLEGAYAQIRSHEQELALDHLDPVDAIRKLVDYTFGYSSKTRNSSGCSTMKTCTMRRISGRRHISERCTCR